MAGPIRADNSFRPSYRPAPPAPGGLDPEVQRIGLIAAAVGAGIAIIVGAATLGRGGPHHLPVIEAEAGPIRVRPANPGGMTVTGAELGNTGNASEQQLMPTAEQPELRKLKAQMLEMKKQLAREEQVAAQTKKLAELAAATPKIAAVAPVAKASATALIERPAAPVSVPLPPATVLASGGTQVQLAAFTDEKSARDAWAALTRKLPEILGGRVADVAPITVAGHTMWRVRTGEFGTVADATSFCAKLRAQSVACTVAAF